MYAFDTGFVCHARGWGALRGGDPGVLWEHFVPNKLHARLQTREIGYWRDKRQHEIDFVFRRRGKAPVAIEGKWSAEGFKARNVAAFRQIYSKGENFVVSRDVRRAVRKTLSGCEIEFVSLEELVARPQA